MVFQNHKNRSFQVRRGVPPGSVLGHVLFSLFVNDPPVSLLSSVSCSLNANNLAIWSTSLSIPAAVEATPATLIRLERWSEYWCLFFNPSKCEDSFLVNPHQTNLQPHLFLLNSRLRFNPTSTFFWVTFDRTLFFSKHVSSLKAKCFPRLKPYAVSFLANGAPLRSTSLFRITLFFGPISLMLHPDGFLTNLTELERLHRAASRAITGCLSSFLIPLLM